MPTTANLALPYPAGAATPNVPYDLQQLAEALDTILSSPQHALAGHAVFRATLAASSQSIPSGTDTALTFGTPIIDALAGWVGGTPTRYTPTEAGYYAVSGAIRWPSTVGSSAQRGIVVRKNGSTSEGSGFVPAAGSGLVTSVLAGVIVECNGTTDYIEVLAAQSSGSALNAEAGGTGRDTQVNIVYVGPAA